MVTGLMDTDIVVDLLRHYPPARNWFAMQKNLGVVQITWIEVLQGTRNKQAQSKALRFLHTFETLSLNEQDFTRTIQALGKYHLSHNLMGFDALIASVSYRLQIPLYTRNLKHFTPLLGTLAQRPY